MFFVCKNKKKYNFELVQIRQSLESFGYVNPSSPEQVSLNLERATDVVKHGLMADLDCAGPVLEGTASCDSDWRPTPPECTFLLMRLVYSMPLMACLTFMESLFAPHPPVFLSFSHSSSLCSLSLISVYRLICHVHWPLWWKIDLTSSF